MKKQQMDLNGLPYTLKILAENAVRNDPMQANCWNNWSKKWLAEGSVDAEINFIPSRVLMQDFTGVPAIVDLAAMRDAMAAWGKDPEHINPQCRVDLVIDHSVINDVTGQHDAFQKNVAMEYERNEERYQFLKWGQSAFKRFRVVPPGTGICHQVNLEHLAEVVLEEDGVLFPDSLVGTDSHTTMINGLGVLGWGVGGIEAEAAMLGQPITLRIPDVVGVELNGQLKDGVTATDMVLTITARLRSMGVVGKFVEFFGEGVSRLSVAERATVANMAPEMGATCAFFPVDQKTIDYLRLTGRSDSLQQRVKSYCKDNGLWHDPETHNVRYSQSISIDLNAIEPCLAGPKRPQDQVPLAEMPSKARALMPTAHTYGGLQHGAVVIASITSCTNTSNPGVLIGAGLLAKAAVERGLNSQKWVKTSFAPGSKVVIDYLKKLNLMEPLEALGFHLTGYGCTTCIGNSGPLNPDITRQIKTEDLWVSAVLSGNRNFEGRVHPLTKANWLASPPLVVAYALAGRIDIDFERDPIGEDAQGTPVLLKELWPSMEDIQQEMSAIQSEQFIKQYGSVFEGDALWKGLECRSSSMYDWNETSTYVQPPAFFKDLPHQPEVLQKITGAHILALLGDSITTDHISPAGVIQIDGPAGHYLQQQGIMPVGFNSYGSRRGNSEVMTRGTFANIRIRNAMTPQHEGGWTRHIPSNEIMSIYDAAMKYQQEDTPLVIMAGREYGTGSSRDWAAKGTLLLGVKAVIAESFERIHRSNLIGMGVLPLQWQEGQSWSVLELDGRETIDLFLHELKGPKSEIKAVIHRRGQQQQEIILHVRIDTQSEWDYYCHGGILNFVLRNLAQA